MQNLVLGTGERGGVGHRPEMPVMGNHRPGLDVVNIDDNMVATMASLALYFNILDTKSDTMCFATL